MAFSKVTPGLGVSISALLVISLVSVHTGVLADDLIYSTRYGFTAKPVTTDFDVDQSGDGAISTSVASGLAVSLNNPLLEVALDYDLNGEVTSRNSVQGVSYERVFDHSVSASVRSAWIDDFLNLSAAIEADTLVEEIGQGYQVRLEPKLQKSIADIALIDLSYSYRVNKQEELAVERLTHGVSLGLSGELIDGKVTWEGGYSDAMTLVQSELASSEESMDFFSSYQLLPHMRVDLTGSYFSEQYFYSETDDRYAEVNYAAGVSWQPMERYRISVKVNKTDILGEQDQGMHGSGEISWLPRDKWKVSLGYGDRLHRGVPGVLLSASIRLNNF